MVMAYRSGFAAIVGRPNVGKSTLLNYIVRQKVSIISDKPQTTRNRISGVKHLLEGQIVFFDTPGIHLARTHLNRKMVQTALSCLHEVDLILWVVEPDVVPREQDVFILDCLDKIKQPKILVVNKIDLIKSNTLIPILDGYGKRGDFSEIIPISAGTGENVDRLVSMVISMMPEGGAYFPEDMVTDQPVRFLASEVIREKVILKTRHEIPYAVAVSVEEYKEDPVKNRVNIQATLYVEKVSQKGILIGAAGRMLKEIGKAAREELEGLLGVSIYMELWVKVKKDWSRNNQFLKEMGY